MKKLLSSVAILALITSGVNAADNQIITNAQINVDGYVGFSISSVQAKTLTGTSTAQKTGLFVNDALNTIDFGDTEVSTDFDGASSSDTVANVGGLATIDRPIFVLSNALSGVTMSITDVGPMVNTSTGAGGIDADEQIALTYKWTGTGGGAALAAGANFSVLDAGATSDGGTTTGSLTISAAQPLALQVAGTYSKTTAVVITVN